MSQNKKRKKLIIEIPSKESTELMTQIMVAEVLYGAEFLKWVMDNMKWLLKEYEKKHESK